MPVHSTWDDGWATTCCERRSGISHLKEGRGVGDFGGVAGRVKIGVGRFLKIVSKNACQEKGNAYLHGPLRETVLAGGLIRVGKKESKDFLKKGLRRGRDRERMGGVEGVD